MKKLLTIVALVVLVAPAAFAAPPDGTGKPESPGKSQAAKSRQQSVQENAAKLCKAERGTTAESRAAFREKYGTNSNKANAFGKCVSKKAKELQEKAEQAEEARENAAKLCKAERAKDPATFKTTYGTNPSKANAFGKCVSKKAKELQKKAQS